MIKNTFILSDILSHHYRFVTGFYALYVCCKSLYFGPRYIPQKKSAAIPSVSRVVYFLPAIPYTHIHLSVAGNASIIVSLNSKVCVQYNTMVVVHDHFIQYWFTKIS